MKPNWKRVAALGVGYITILTVLTSIGYSIFTWQYWVILFAVLYVGVVSSLEFK